MAEFKRTEDILARIAEREQIQGLVEPKVPSALKYKKGDGASSRSAKRPDLAVGARLVIRVSTTTHGGMFLGNSYSDIVGYALGVVIDFNSLHNNYGFYCSAQAILQITKVTSDKLLGLVGRLASVTINDWDIGVKFAPQEVQLSDYKWVEVPE